MIVSESSRFLSHGNADPPQSLSEALRQVFDVYRNVSHSPIGLNDSFCSSDSVLLLSNRIFWAYPSSEKKQTFEALVPLRNRLYSSIQPIIQTDYFEEISNRGHKIIQNRISIPPITNAVISSFNGSYSNIVNWVLFGEVLELDRSVRATCVPEHLILRLYDSSLSSVGRLGSDANDSYFIAEDSEYNNSDGFSKSGSLNLCRFRLAMCIHAFILASELSFVFCKEVLFFVPEEGPWKYPVSSLSTELVMSVNNQLKRW